MSDRLLITGSTGFIGSHVATLAKQHTWDVFTERVDLLVPEETDRLMARIRPTHLIHLAWFVEPAQYWTSPANMLWLGASLRLFHSFVQHHGRRLVGVGTSAEYDWSEGILREGVTPLTPATLYGASKKGLGEEALTICTEHGISAAWARLFMVYGPGESPSRFIPTAIRARLTGGTVRCADPVARDFIHVRDAAAALVALARSPVAGAVNVGSGEATTLRAVAGRIGAQIEIIDRGTEAPLVVADTTRLRKEVGLTPQIGLDRGLAESIEWWRERYRR